MAIEASRVAVDRLPVTPQMIASLRESARLLTTHYSTQIEGNRLTLPQVEEVIAGGGGFPGRERDEREVQNYYKAADEIESLAALKRKLTEKDIQTIHGLAFEGKKRPTPYRDGQNVIRNSASGAITYLPPEASLATCPCRSSPHWRTTSSPRFTLTTMGMGAPRGCSPR